jgi:putative transposase
MRKVKFVTGEYYHICNRGVDKRDVFLDEGDYGRFLRSMSEFNNNSTSRNRDYFLRKNAGAIKELSSRYRELSSLIASLPKLVSIVAYCINPNHFHLLLQQLADNGIEKFMHKLGSGYTNYFNIKYGRSGSLFEGPFKSVAIDSEEHLLWVAAYVNGNAQIHGLVPDAANSKWCSYPEYLGKTDLNVCAKSEILDKFKDISLFQEASEKCFKKMKERKDLQRYILD